MKQIVIISGKGGTGKTVIAASFAALAKNKVMVDCDVDAANLYLLLHPSIKTKEEFIGGKVAVLDQEKCTGCKRCVEVCRAQAISSTEDSIIIDPISCEGCSICSYICPVDAIKMKERISGKWYISDTKYGPMVHSRLGVAQENSGKLVTIVKQKAISIAEKQSLEYIIIDGAPGIGCPVIASIAQADLALIVTEPTMSGLYDADRVIQVSRHFGVPVKLVINKWDLNIEITDKIEKYCKDNDIDVVGRIPFDRSVVDAMVNGKTVVEYSNGEAKKAIVEVWNRVVKAV